MSFNRSSGPGGQNVNKLSTKASLRLRKSQMSWIPLLLRTSLKQHASQYLTKEGDLIISSQRSRTQEQNREDCFIKLISILRQTGNASLPGETSDATRQKVSKQMRHGNEVRLKSKKMASQKKSSRRSKGSDD